MKSTSKAPPDPTTGADLLSLLAAAAEDVARRQHEHEARRPGFGHHLARGLNDSGAVNLTTNCLCCRDGYRESTPADAPPRRDLCVVCGGTAAIVTTSGAAVLGLLRHVLAPQIHTNATSGALAEWNKQQRIEWEAQQKLAADQARERAAELRAMADDLGRDPSMFERVRDLLRGKAE